MKEWVYQGESTVLAKVLADMFGYAAAQKLLRKRDVKINGVRTGDNVKICKGDKILAYVVEVDPLKGRVIFEDSAVLVLDKPRNMDTYEAAEKLSVGYGTVIPVHRLDRNTNGVMIFARTENAQTVLEDCFKSGKTTKIYRAEVVGCPQQKEATLTAYLFKDAKNSLVHIFDSPRYDRQKIVTQYRVLEERSETSILEVALLTGRTHQIRAHLAFAGYPVLGDGKYGDNEFNRRHNKKMQCLTCVSLHVCPDGDLYYLKDMTFKSSCKN